MSSVSFAQVEVGFLELHHWNGEIWYLEPGFPYAHLAIRYRGKWLHAHPVRGVELIDSKALSAVGDLKKVLTANLPDVSQETVSSYLGLSYDSEFSWSNEKIYCAELVAKILRIPPSPMHFDPLLWPESYLKYEGRPGSSPQKIYDYILKHR